MCCWGAVKAKQANKALSLAVTMADITNQSQTPFPNESGWGFSTHSSRPLPKNQRPEWVTRDCTPGPVESESQLSHLLGVCPPSGNHRVGLWPGREGVSDESTLSRLSVSSLLGSGARELGQKLLRSLWSVL